MRILPHRYVAEASSPPRGGKGAARGLRFARDTRGAAGVELALGAFAVLGLAVTCFAAYSRIEAAASAPRIAIAMAEYVSREEAPDGDQLDALARYLRDHELGADYDVLIVTTAIHKEAGESAAVLWIDRIALGDAAETTKLGETCTGRRAGDGTATLGDDFAMDDGEIVFLVEVCARSAATSWTGVLHHHYLLPTRHPDELPPAPVRTPGNGPV